MDIIVEFLFDILFDGALELIKYKKIPRLVRYPIAIILLLLICSVVALVGIIGIVLLIKSDLFSRGIGLLFIGLFAFFMRMLIIRVNKFVKGEAVKDEKF